MKVVDSGILSELDVLTTMLKWTHRHSNDNAQVTLSVKEGSFLIFLSSRRPGCTRWLPQARR